MGKIKVAWICNFSNKELRSNLKFRKATIEKWIRRTAGKSTLENHDYGAWITNGIECFKSIEDVELHIIAPHHHISGRLQEFETEGIFYHIFSSEAYSLYHKLRVALTGKTIFSYKKNRQIILSIIEKVSPNIVHVIGAENEDYALSVLDLPTDIPIIVHLQTLLNDPEFIRRSPIYSDYKRACEIKVLQRADYIGTTVEHFKELISESIVRHPKFVGIKLAVGEQPNRIPVPKKYDFVYFSVNINKSVDYAIEAFAIAQKQYPQITLDIIGGYSADYKRQIDNRIKELGIESNVIFEGLLPTHDDVLHHIHYSKFALLPLKVDMIAGTIREAMAAGLPVVTTITPATPKLNENRRSVLLSEKGDFQSMADNMIALINSNSLCHELVSNADITLMERYNNDSAMREWVEAYSSILKENKVC